MAKKTLVIEYEQFVFDLLNQLCDEFGLEDNNGSFARAIQNANTIEELSQIAKQLQRHLIEAVKQKAIAEVNQILLTSGMKYRLLDFHDTSNVLGSFSTLRDAVRLAKELVDFTVLICNVETNTTEAIVMGENVYLKDSDKEIGQLADLLDDIYHEYTRNYGELTLPTMTHLEEVVKEYQSK